jgi:hypothetical protein
MVCAVFKVLAYPTANSNSFSLFFYLPDYQRVSGLISIISIFQGHNLPNIIHLIILTNNVEISVSAAQLALNRF